MKEKKRKQLIRRTILVIIIISVMLIQFVGNINTVKASTTISSEANNVDRLYIALKALNDNGWGYGYYGGIKRIWSIVSYNEDGTYVGSTNNLYCAQADYGNTWQQNGTDAIATYNLSYDFNKDIGTTPSNIINGIVSGEHFNEILWLVDNMYVPGESKSINKFLEQADIYYSEEEGGYVYISRNRHDYIELGLASGDVYGYTLTEDDIIAIQQAALWYFTNNSNSNYNRKGIESWLQYTLNGSDYYFLTSYSNRYEGEARNEFATVLFNYFVDEAEAVAAELGSQKYELKKSTVKLWLSTSDGTENGTDNEEQPLLEIHKLKEFDLALRKAIVSVQNEQGVYSQLNNIYGSTADRILNTDGSIKQIDTETLNSETTATYNHRKDPIVVEEGDIVEYAITIYNEGQADGYAKSIVDQLPLTGLILQSNDDVTSSTGNVYEVTYSAVDNKVEFNLKSAVPVSIPGYDGTTLSHETLKLKCIVTANVDDENAQILTNISYISEAHNSDTEEDITTSEVGADRDSAPGAYPTYQGTENDDKQNGVTYWNTTSQDFGYIGNSENSADLSNSNSYYKGIEDDDDFEKIVIMPKMDITVTKKWDDNNNQDGKREDYEVTLTGKVGDTVVYTDVQTLGETETTYTWPGLAKYSAGQEIVYEVAETGVPNDYEASVDTFTITNKHEPEKTEVTVTKVWDDNNNQDGKRTNYEVTLTGKVGDEVVYTNAQTLTADQLTYTWKDLDKYSKGQLITYTVDETQVPTGYTKSVNGYTITNTYEPEKTEVTVTKVWDDNNNQDGKRTNYEVTLTGKVGDEVVYTNAQTLTADQLTYTWKDLDKYSKGQLITYTVDETQVPTGYTKSVNGYTITNIYIPSTTEITVNKTWVDNNNQDGIRPDSITIILKANDEEIDRKTLTAGEDKIWQESELTHTFTDLPGYENGVAIIYKVEEIVPAGYIETQNETVENGTRVITITNTHIADVVSKEVLKIWDDNNNQDGIRPNSIQVQLYADGEEYGEVVTLTAGEDGIWQDTELRHTWNNLPKYKEGKLITYSVKEINIAKGYTASYGTAEGTEEAESTEIATTNKKMTVAEIRNLNTVTIRKSATVPMTSAMQVAEEKNEILTIANTHIPETTEVIVEKLWNDSNNQYEVRPDSIKVQLFANGQIQGEPIELNNSMNWKYTWLNLPKRENGQDIEYTVKEINAENKVVETGQKYNDNYVTAYEQSNNKITIINTQLSFDLKLIKYISAINNEDVQNRLQNVDLSKLNTYDENLKKWISTGKYTLEKEPVKVEQNDYITYTFRVYNEGDYDGYALEISENIPEELEFVNITDEVPEKMQEMVLTLNSDWEYDEATGLLKTNKLSETLLKGYGKQNIEYSDSENKIDYTEISVILKVKEDITQGKVIRNEVAISQDKAVDENGNEVNVDDRDSNPKEWNKENSEETYDEEGKWPIYVEDDEDYDNIITKIFDLSLRKRIAQIKDVDTQKTRLYSRMAILDTDNSQANTLYNYYNKYASVPEVKAGDIVTYSLVVYNEGEIDGYASLIVDTLPKGLEFVEYEPGDGSINDKYGWKLVEGTENVYQTDYLSYEKDTNKGTENSTILKAYEGEGEASYQEIYIECRVKAEVTKEESLLNVAQIAEDSDANGEPIKDKDSVPGTSDDENNWKEEDDLDIEILELQEFDLALRKFITQIEKGEKIEEVTTRIPEVRYEEETKQIIYTHPKDALVVHVGDTVIYTIRVYNEGDIDGYAKTIKDDIPEYLEYLPEHETNKEYEWVMYDEEGNETEEVTKAVYICTEHLAKGRGVEADEESEETNLIKAFNEEEEISETNPDHKEVKVAFKVKDPNSTEYEIVNFAQISEDTDSEGDPIEDRDSEPDNGEEEPKEDDEDIEKVKVEYFDLSLLKYVTKVLVNENGEERVIETGNVGDENDIIPHVQINKKNIDKTVVKFIYTIQITNEGQIAGEARKITDYVPEGLIFVEEDNELWTDEGNNVISTKQLEGTVLQPGETAQVEVVLRWKNGADNLGAKTNVAEISEDYNEEEVPDRDSTPDNKKEGEDDIDEATVLLSVNQGGGIQSIYINLGVTFLTIILVGGILIKKFVL